jgi:hypothetical protein
VIKGNARARSARVVLGLRGSELDKLAMLVSNADTAIRNCFAEATLEEMDRMNA